MKKTFIFCFIVFYSLILSGCTQEADNYSYNDHYNNVKQLIEEKYMQSNYGFTGFELYPIYNENDEHKYFLVEFEPIKFLYVFIKDKSTHYGNSLYCTEIEYLWTPYTVSEKEVDGKIKYIRNFKLDEFGNRIIHNRSHFKVAGVENEKLYLLTVYPESYELLIPAVKRGDKYLNLVSMEIIDYVKDVPKGSQATTLNIPCYPPNHLQ